jgi:hypothetical protein
VRSKSRTTAEWPVRSRACTTPAVAPRNKRSILSRLGRNVGMNPDTALLKRAPRSAARGIY